MSEIQPDKILRSKPTEARKDLSSDYDHQVISIAQLKQDFGALCRLIGRTLFK